MFKFFCDYIRNKLKNKAFLYLLKKKLFSFFYVYFEDSVLVNSGSAGGGEYAISTAPSQQDKNNLNSSVLSAENTTANAQNESTSSTQSINSTAQKIKNMKWNQDQLCLEFEDENCKQNPNSNKPDSIASTTSSSATDLLCGQSTSNNAIRRQLSEVIKFSYLFV